MSKVRRIGTAKKNLLARKTKLRQDILDLPVPEKLRLAADYLDQVSSGTQWGAQALVVAKRAVFEIEGAMRQAESEPDIREPLLARVFAAERELELARLEADAVGSLLLDVQQDAIAKGKRVAELERMLALVPGAP